MIKLQKFCLSSPKTILSWIACMDLSMDCFIELSNDVKGSIQYKKIKEVLDIANNVLISSIDFGFKSDDLIVKNFLRQIINFQYQQNIEAIPLKPLIFFI